MAQASAPPFQPPAIPWLVPSGLPAHPELGPGLDPQALRTGLQCLCDLEEVRAVVAFGSRARGEARADSDLDLAVILREPQLTPERKLEAWRRCRQALGHLGVGNDLVVVGWSDAERLSQSRWHVLGDVARQGQVLYVAG
ncbi:MAG: nucleotidyltransferase family protein [Cyanobium sp.]